MIPGRIVAFALAFGLGLGLLSLVMYGVVMVLT